MPAQGTPLWSEFGVTPEAAIRALVEKLGMTQEAYQALAKEYQSQGFYVAGLEEENAINAVQDSLVEALDEGQTYEQWLDGVDEVFEKAGWVPANPYHVRTVFNTNLLGAYNAGRYEQAFDPDVVERLPWFEYRKESGYPCPICDPLDGFKAPKDDPVWQNIYPPNHFNCACGVFSIPAPEGADPGSLPENYIGPAAGFDHAPGTDKGVRATEEEEE